MLPIKFGFDQKVVNFSMKPGISLTKTRESRHRSHLSMERQLSTSATMPAGIQNQKCSFKTQRCLVDPIHTMKNPYTKFGSWVKQPKMKPRRGDFIDRWEGKSDFGLWSSTEFPSNFSRIYCWCNYVTMSIQNQYSSSFYTKRIYAVEIRNSPS